jgi:glycosyltransferase involved in cell wall biosynthesis
LDDPITNKDKQVEPVISVVMSVYNGARYLQEAISSVLDQSFRDFEFIIVDDGSTDDTVAIIESNSDDRIRLIQSDSNRGLAASLNTGFGAARGEFIARQDADDISAPERFEVQVAKLRGAQHPTVIGGNWSIIDSEGREVAIQQLPVDAETVRSNLVDRNIRFPHGSMMLSRSIVEQVGGYDSNFIYSQDLEFQLRIAAAGFDICAVSDAVYKYRVLPQQNRRKTLLQSRFREIANRRFRSDDWTIPVGPSVISAAREKSSEDGRSPENEIGRYWYALSLISARAFRPKLALFYLGRCVKSGNRVAIAKLLVKLPLNLLINSWATVDGRRSR